ncbi:MAG: penicillin-binding protein 1C [candidate division FCPU426 bacterium]
MKAPRWIRAAARWPLGVRWLLALAAAGGLAWLAVPLPHPLFPDDYSPVVLDADGKLLRVFLNRRQQWMLPTDPGRPVPVKLKAAVLAYEDRTFYRHPGVSLRALLRAAAANCKHRRVRSGASTLTMQIARLARPKARTLPNKLLEMAQACKLELLTSKENLLRLYLDHAPYGGNIVGYQAASWRYFGKPPDQLTWSEAATLAVLPNSPSLMTPVLNREALVAKRGRLLRILTQQGRITPAECALAQAEPVPDRLHPFPLHAPHAALRLLGKRKGSPAVRSSLQLDTQQACEGLLRRHMQYLRSLGVRNACLLAVETRTGLVRAYVGSQDFLDVEGRGQVDGVQAPRSSGSLLKPFLYAAAMDEGLILPDMLTWDVPTHFSGFTPQNNDLAFLGLVSAREALIQSRNVPAVRLLHAVGVYPFYLWLEQAGVSTLFRKPEEYGLALVLGGAEVTLWDMVALYCGLGRGGRFAPLRLALSDPGPSGRLLLLPGSDQLLLEMLREVKRPEGEYYWEQYNRQRPVAWKTGTSYGQRDGWAVGTSPNWTIGVWTGNFTGEGNPNLSGGRCAAPLLFDCFNTLPALVPEHWFNGDPGSLVSCAVCRETGFLAGPDCPHRVAAKIPKDAKPFRTCPYHRVCHLSPDRRHSVCASCWDPERHLEEVRLVYPPQVMQVLRQQGRDVAGIAPHLPACSSVEQDSGMEITYPAERARIWIPRGLAGEPQRVVVQVSHRDRNRKVFWYVDKNFRGETREPHARAFLLETGWHTVDVVDESGQRLRRTFQVAVKPGLPEAQ